MTQHHGAPPVLLVDDSDEDAQVFRRALGKPPSVPLVHCGKGREALDYLRRRGRFAGSPAPAPRLLVLDLNLPDIDGRDLLSLIKGDRTLPRIPVVILSTSTNPRDIERCYRDGACGYIVKVLDVKRYTTTVQSVISYWYETVRLPVAPLDGSP